MYYVGYYGRLVPPTHTREKLNRFQWELIIALFNTTEGGKINPITSGYIFTEMD